MNQDQKNHDTQKIVPLSNSEIESILKSQSESIFEDKNISNNSNFVKKSLIDIALDFNSKQKIQEDEPTNKIQENTKNFEEENEINNDNQKKEETKNDENNTNDKIIDAEVDELNLNKVEEENESEKLSQDQELPNVESDNQKQNKADEVNVNKVEEENESEKLSQDQELPNVESDNQKQNNDVIDGTNPTQAQKGTNETQQALDSVRDAVSQSMDNSKDKISKNLEKDSELPNSVSEKIIKDYEEFKNVLSALPSLGERAIYEVIENKIIEIAYELAGYQIDKMPEKYEKKIKSFIKNINCYEDKISVEINDKDFDALSKIENFNKIEEKTVFISNKELSRGDIVLNCDGMHYSEKSMKSI